LINEVDGSHNDLRIKNIELEDLRSNFYKLKSDFMDREVLE
jgi:hypothetical protein